jgi:hypothetical protein
MQRGSCAPCVRGARGASARVRGEQGAARASASSPTAARGPFAQPRFRRLEVISSPTDDDTLFSTQARPQEFGNSRKDVLLIGGGLLVAGFGSYYAMLVRPLPRRQEGRSPP